MEKIVNMYWLNKMFIFGPMTSHNIFVLSVNCIQKCIIIVKKNI